MSARAMQRRILQISAVVAVALSAGSRATQAQSSSLTSIVGTWHTVSDVDGKPRGVVEIREDHGQFIGTARGTLVANEQANRLCDKCPGDRKGKPILGMEILRGLHADGDEWTGGEILDPDTGKVYKAKVKLIDGGKKLVLRGFIGFSLIGRSQTWLRAD